tara:strand:- start:664 stop:915 length:252 start_codon:yes stop_codon:yes gene_type:complete
MRNGKIKQFGMRSDAGAAASGAAGASVERGQTVATKGRHSLSYARVARTAIAQTQSPVCNTRSCLAEFLAFLTSICLLLTLFE